MCLDISKVVISISQNWTGESISRETSLIKHIKLLKLNKEMKQIMIQVTRQWAAIATHLKTTLMKKRCIGMCMDSKTLCLSSKRGKSKNKNSWRKSKWNNRHKLILLRL